MSPQAMLDTCAADGLEGAGHGTRPARPKLVSRSPGGELLSSLGVLLALMAVTAVALATDAEELPPDDGPGAAVMAWLRAAEQGEASAQNNLGLAYLYGDGVPQNDGEAVRWFRMAAEQGSAWAQYQLGFLYELGDPVPRDDREAVKWYGRAAAQGDVNAMYGLRNFLEDSTEAGVEARAWFRSAAEQGNVRACEALGQIHESGSGVARDLREAIRWYHCAADAGETSAQKSLGMLYAARGQGVPDPDAHFLGRLYAEISRAPNDYVKAHMWLGIAASRGDRLAGAARDEVGRKMTADQIAEAEGLAREWLATHGIE